MTRLPLAILILLAMPVAAQAADGDLGLIAGAIRSGRLIQARIMLDRAAEAAAPADAPEIATLQAELALAEGRDGDAEAAFAVLAAKVPDDCRATRGLGMAAVNLRHTDMAIKALLHAGQACPADWHIQSALGTAYADAGRWQESDAAYAAAHQAAGDEPMLLNNMAVALIRQQRVAEAKTLLDRAAIRDPGNERILNNIDIAAGSAGEAPVRAMSDSAERWAERLTNAGYAAMLAGRRGDAEAWLSQAVAASPVYATVAARNLALLESKR